MSECKNCGKEIPREANVCCENCGESVDQVLEDALKSMDENYKVKSWEDMQKEGFSPFKELRPHYHSPLEYFSQGHITLKVGDTKSEIVNVRTNYFLWFLLVIKQWWDRRKEKKRLKKMMKAFGDPSKFTPLIHVPERNRIDLPIRNLPILNPMTEVKYADTFDPSVRFSTIDPTRTNILPASEMKKQLLDNPIFPMDEKHSTIKHLYRELVEKVMAEYPCCMIPDYRGTVKETGIDGMPMKEYMVQCNTCRKMALIRSSWYN